jgi:hypothetical protein
VWRTDHELGIGFADQNEAGEPQQAEGLVNH